MKNVVRSLITIMFLVMSKPGFCQRDTVIYTGVNGKLVGEEKADTRRNIIYRSSIRIDILTSRWSGKKWQEILHERITRARDNTFHIKNADVKKEILTIRSYDRQTDGSYLFSEYKGKNLIKTGRTLHQFPLILDGESVEYYENGQVKSRSFFRNNELISNQNWLEDGEKYIDSLFYSVDEEPMLLGGNLKIHQHVLQAFKDTGLDFSSVSGNLLLGFVVMETGEITGIRVLKSISSQINGIAVSALQTLDGIWKPAKLDGKPVRYFQLFPINFIRKEATFDYMEFSGKLIHFDKNLW
jgi:hypothetical protein